MEKRIKKPAGLTALFWRYLLTTGAVIILLAILWWFWMIVMMRNGIVYPANTAANGVETVVQALSAGELDTADIPYFYRWAIFDDRGEVLSDGKMDQRHLDYAKAALAGEPDPQGMFYSQYHRLTQMPDGTTCVIQYDYSMPYGSEVLQGRLPEFQTCAAIILLLSWLAVGAISTHHFAGLLRRDAALLTGATETIAQQRLDTPLSGKARVREFGETLTAMEQMRLSLAQSLERQWAMEQQRRLELAALTHDLKTPLTVISGNAELLAEDSLPAAQEEMVNTILHSAIRLQDYVAQLRAMTAEGAPGLWMAGDRAEPLLCKTDSFPMSFCPQTGIVRLPHQPGSGGEQSAGQCSSLYAGRRADNSHRIQRGRPTDHCRGGQWPRFLPGGLGQG